MKKSKLKVSNGFSGEARLLQAISELQKDCFITVSESALDCLRETRTDGNTGQSTLHVILWATRRWGSHMATDQITQLDTVATDELR